MNEQMAEFSVDLVQMGQVVLIRGVSPTKVALDDGHPIGRQGAGLIRADGCRVAHGFAGVQVSNQVVILQKRPHFNIFYPKK